MCSGYEELVRRGSKEEKEERKREGRIGMESGWKAKKRKGRR